jgi:DNA-binding MarR family transcriptional regulator
MTEIEINVLFNQSNNDIGYLIWQLMRIWKRGKQKVLSEFDLTSSQLDVLGSIGRLQLVGEQLTQKALSQDTEIDPMTISTILRNLQKKGLITRTKCESDMRARLVELTETGYALLRKAYAKSKECKQIIFESIDEEIFKTQIKLLLSAMSELETQ